MKQSSRILFRLSLLVALMMGASSSLSAIETEVHIEADGIMYYAYYNGFKDDAVANYAFVVGPINKQEERAYSISETVDYELKWTEQDPNGNNVERSKTLTFKVTKIGNYAFKKSKLTTIGIPNTIEVIGGGAFENCVNLKFISLPPSVKEIGGDMCRGCTSLCKAGLNTTITQVPDGAFQGCTSLLDFSFPLGIKTIGTSAFQDCTNLIHMEFRSNVETIGATAFVNCTRLANITIWDNLFIGIYAFYGCPLTDIFVHCCTPPVNNMAFETECWERTTVHVPFGCYDNYQERKFGWSEFKNIVYLSMN